MGAVGVAMPGIGSRSPESGMTFLIRLVFSNLFLGLNTNKRAPAKAVLVCLCLFSVKVEAQNQPSFAFLPGQIQGIWEIEEIDFSGISAVAPEDAEPFIGRHIEIGNSRLDIFGYRCRVDRYEAELIDNRAGYFGERWLFSNDLKSADLRKAPDFYPDWLQVELSCAEDNRPAVTEADSVFFCISGNQMDGKSFDYFGGDVLVTSCDGPNYILRRVVR